MWGHYVFWNWEGWDWGCFFGGGEVLAEQADWVESCWGWVTEIEREGGEYPAANGALFFTAGSVAVEGVEEVSSSLGVCFGDGVVAHPTVRGQTGLGADYPVERLTGQFLIAGMALFSFSYGHGLVPLTSHKK